MLWGVLGWGGVRRGEVREGRTQGHTHSQLTGLTEHLNSTEVGAAVAMGACSGVEWGEAGLRGTNAPLTS